MVCWSFNSTREIDELHRSYEDIAAKNLELSTAFKKAEQEREGLRLQLEAKQLEIQELSRKLRDAAALESRLQTALERSQADAAEAAQQQAAGARQLEESVKEGRQFRQDNELLLRRVDKLGREKAYLQQRCDRMTQALAMLEDVLDETLSEPRASAARMDSLRQSKNAVLQLLDERSTAGAGGSAMMAGSFEPHNNPIFEGRVKLAPEAPASRAATRYGVPAGGGAASAAVGMSPRSPLGSPRKATPQAGAAANGLDAADVQVALKDQKV